MGGNLVKYLTFEWDRPGENDIESGDPVARHHDKPISSYVMDIPYLSSVEARLTG
jgi:hypothetical protein